MSCCAYNAGCAASCPYPAWTHPLCGNPARYSCAGYENGPTLVIHQIVLGVCANQTCEEKTFNLRITGPSYPNGEVFPLRAGSCLTLDEPLVLSGLTPGTYTIEQIFATPNEYITTITGPVCGNTVTLPESCVPTVVTLVSRKRLCRLCVGYGCGCSACALCCN